MKKVAKNTQKKLDNVAKMTEYININSQFSNMLELKNYTELLSKVDEVA